MKKLTTILFALVATMALCFAQSEPKKMAVATFDVTGGAVTKDEVDAITELYISELVATGKVTVVDRMNFDKIVKEMKFQASDWSNKEKTAALGNAVNAQIVARGQVIKLGSKLYLSTTVIDVKTAAILTSARKQFNTIDDIFSLLPTLASDLLASINYKIGDTGPGGGIIYYIEGNRYYECTGLLGRANWKDAKKMCQEHRGGGFDDWYLPTKEDLNRIYKNLKTVGISAADEYFWSSSPGNDSDRAWEQRFSDGNQNNYGYKHNTHCVRAVRGFSESAPFAKKSETSSAVKLADKAAKYTIGDTGLGGGMIFRVRDGKCWECSGKLGKASLASAKTMCKNYRGGGYSDWRLPDQLEWIEIYEKLYRAGKSLGNKNDIFWTSETLPTYGTPLAIHFDDGKFYDAEKDTQYYVIAVRDFVK